MCPIWPELCISDLQRQAGGSLDSQQVFKERPEELKVEGVGAVGFGVGRIVVDFDKETVDAGGDGGAGEERDELRLAAADAVGSRRLLHGVGGVEDDGGEPAHHGKRAEIDDEVVVAEASTAFGEQDALVAGRADFLHTVSHIPGGDELAFLDVDGAAGAARGDEKVGLAAEERGNLEDIDGFGDDTAVSGFVNVGKDRRAGIPGDAAEDARAFSQAGTAEALHAGAIGFVVTGFEDERNLEAGSDALKGFGHGARVRLRFDDAGTGDEKEPARANLHRPDFKGRCHDTNSIVLRGLCRRSAAPPATLDGFPTLPQRARKGGAANDGWPSQPGSSRGGCATTPTKRDPRCGAGWDRATHFAA